MSFSVGMHTMVGEGCRMSEYYFTFRSVTSAMRAQRQMQELGVRATLTRTPLPLRKQGCGYSLRLQGQAFETARLHMNGHQRIYRKDGEVWTEVFL